MSSIVRACITKARGAHDRYVQSEWPDDRVAELLIRSAQTPTSIASSAALATTTVYFISSLVPVSAAAAVISRSLQLSFDGAAVLTIPSLTLPQASWVTEGGAIPVIQGLAAAGVSIEPYKLATMLVLTNELVRHSNAEAVMRQVLQENVGPTLDAAMFSAAAAVPGLRPPGILNGISPLTATTGGGLAAVVGDLKLIGAALAPVTGGGEPVLICAPAQAAALAQLPLIADDRADERRTGNRHGDRARAHGDRNRDRSAADRKWRRRRRAHGHHAAGHRHTRHAARCGRALDHCVSDRQHQPALHHADDMDPALEGCCRMGERRHLVRREVT